MPWEKLKRQNEALKAELEMLKSSSDSLRNALELSLAQLDSLNALNASIDENTVSEVPEINLCDSLVHNWYMQQNELFSMDFVPDSIGHFSSNVQDAEFVRRLDAIHSVIPLQFNETVRNYCILYSEKMRSKMGRILGQAQYYWPLFDEIFSAFGVPLEMKALAIVESQMIPTATSRMGAKGLWQFMYVTGRGYGMQIDSWVDERMDPFKSTVGAARYLSDAYKLFGDWLLAIASYNCGINGVNKAMRRSGKSDFWGIYDYLPRETRKYVPAFIGCMYALHYYKECGIAVQSSALAVPIDTFHIHRNVSFGRISSVLGIPEETVSELNPQYFNALIPGKDGSYVLRLPREYTKNFIACTDSLYNGDTLAVKIAAMDSPVSSDGKRIVYKVKKGDSLSVIARRHHVKVDQLKRWNSLKSNNLRIGQKLVIYRR